MRALMVLVVVALIAASLWLGRERWLPVAERTIESVAPAMMERGESGAAADTPAADVRPPDPVTATEPDPGPETPAQVQERAENYVAKLTAPDPEPVRVERADHFVTGEQMLSLIPLTAVETTTIGKLQLDATLTPDSPITVVRQIEQVERVTPEKLIAQSGGDLDRAITVLEDDVPRETTIRQVLDAARRAPDRPIDVVTVSEYFEQTTPRELAAAIGSDAIEPVRVIRARHGLEAASVGELMRAQQISSDSLFYVRTVRAQDSQGIWGIVHDGIIDNFARGMAIRRGREINTYQVEIPVDADERMQDQSSSFLGKLIHRKANASYVYNFKRNRMGRNPDRIIPGQEIVIIDFQPDELIRIYKHFVDRQG